MPTTVSLVPSNIFIVYPPSGGEIKSDSPRAVLAVPRGAPGRGHVRGGRGGRRHGGPAGRPPAAAAEPALYYL